MPMIRLAFVLTAMSFSVDATVPVMSPLHETLASRQELSTSQQDQHHPQRNNLSSPGWKEEEVKLFLPLCNVHTFPMLKQKRQHSHDQWRAFANWVSWKMLWRGTDDVMFHPSSGARPFAPCPVAFNWQGDLYRTRVDAQYKQDLPVARTTRYHTVGTMKEPQK